MAFMIIESETEWPIDAWFSFTSNPNDFSLKKKKRGWSLGSVAMLVDTKHHYNSVQMESRNGFKIA